MCIRDRSLAVAALFPSSSSIEERPGGSPSLTKSAFSNDAFRVEVSYPEHVNPGREVEVEVSVKGRGGFLVSAVVFRAYSCSAEPRDFIMIGLGQEATLIYENSTRPPEPRSELSTTYRFRLPEELEAWLGLVIYVTPVKPGKPMVVHYTEPIVIPIKVEA